ncbi:Rieske (2Fe-2S) domain protein [Pseudoxanthomonas spadix BD-a59]|uniref:Rieske (2Fe-2S) domain protein n=2 Tax=Pseudoxanthomonas spadix TaxID=415229 RepID=G7UVF7_PSEUP|nr:Rieske (2Fe-2S) domain protein [Pseudoxanthomonas spadix BD-a59]
MCLLTEILQRNEVIHFMGSEAKTLDWQRVASICDFGEEDVLCVQAGSRRLALYNVNGEFHATDDMCSHGKASLCEGFLEGYLIECPLHQGLFDVRDGSPAGTPVTEGINSYLVQVDGEEILVRA